MIDHKIHYYSTIKKLNFKEKNIIYEILINHRDVEFLFPIIIIEKMNREHQHLLEKILCFLFPKLVIFLDLSIGLCQIRPSTAQNLIKTDKIKLLKLLCNPISNIDIMCKLMNMYEKQYHSKTLALNYFLTGSKNPKKNKEIKIYHSLVEWSYENKFFSKIIKNDLASSF